MASPIFADTILDDFTTGMWLLLCPCWRSPSKRKYRFPVRMPGYNTTAVSFVATPREFYTMDTTVGERVKMQRSAESRDDMCSAHFYPNGITNDDERFVAVMVTLDDKVMTELQRCRVFCHVTIQDSRGRVLTTVEPDEGDGGVCQPTLNFTRIISRNKLISKVGTGSARVKALVSVLIPESIPQPDSDQS